MPRANSQPSPNVILARLPACDATSDQVIRDIVEGLPDATRKPVMKEKPD